MMLFEFSDVAKRLRAELDAFMQEHVYPVEQLYFEHVEAAESRWASPPLMGQLKKNAKAAGLWNLFIPREHQQYGGKGLGNLDYAPLAETMGRVLWAPEVFNCSAPDTGNMEVLMKYATPAQQASWLEPLLTGECRSAFAMTEPAVASSDATNIECSIIRDGDEYVVNGRKWFITGAMHENCRIVIVMGKSDPEVANRHARQSQILVPIDTPGVTVVRRLRTLGFDDAPFGHAEVEFDNVRVSADNMLLGEGRGFEIAQGRLGPGREYRGLRPLAEGEEIFRRSVQPHIPADHGHRAVRPAQAAAGNPLEVRPRG